MNNLTTTEILVFATNVITIDQMNDVLVNLLLHPGVKQANFDLEDIDKVLRVVSKGITAEEVEQTLLSQKIFCKALA
ncbi:hypothetical protein [Galbibacter sp.]|jgi:hypothetical protein|uniref:hypothetical protein n=1 Tax=Galbibacter sp. TaxID=2918471 RepID=UPI003A8E418D